MNPVKITNASSATRLSLLAIVILVGALFFTVNSALETHQSQSNAWATSESAKAVCNESSAAINVSFTNTETSNALGMNVVAQDIATGAQVNLGAIAAQQTKTGVIQTSKSSLQSGGVIFKLSWSSGLSGTDQRNAPYTSITCGGGSSPAGLAVVSPSCISSGYTGSEERILWSEAAVSRIDISMTSSFGTYYSRLVSGTTSTTAPSGFILHGGTTPLQLNPATTYYVRTWDGFLYSPTISFSIPACQQPTLTPIPTVVPTTAPTPFPTALPTAVPQPTSTSAPGSTALALSIGLHGIGTGGDSANPNSQGNENPLHPSRNVTVEIYDVQNQLVETDQGNIQFDQNSGKFTGTVDLSSNFTTGLYTVKVKTDQYLRAVVPGIQTITAGQTTTLPAVTLVTGDINNDNVINIVDYNILIGCYSDLLPATDCNATNNVLADLTDDGHVNQFDYNLFLRELTNIGGQ